MNMPKDKIEIEKTEGSEKRKIEINLEDVAKDARKLKLLLAKETELLKKMKVKEVGSLHEEKMNLVRKLEIHKELIARDPSVLKGKTSEAVNDFKEVSDGMDEVVRQNFNEVLKAKEVNQKVVEAVFYTVVSQENDSFGYNKKGTNGASGKKTSSPAITINRSV